MRFSRVVVATAVALVCVSALSSCSNNKRGAGETGWGTPSDSQSPSAGASATESASQTPTNSPSASPSSSSRVYASKSLEVGTTGVTAAASQIKCAQGESLVLTSDTRMDAPEYGEVIAVATFSCKTGTTLRSEQVEIFHWRDAAWRSLGIMDMPPAIWHVKGTCAQSTDQVSCPISKITIAQKLTNSHLVVRREGTGFFADFKG